MTIDGNDKRRAVPALLDIAINRPRCVPDLPPGDQDLLLRIARRARILGRLAADLDCAGLLQGMDPHAADQLQSALTTVHARNRLARWELDRIAWAMNDSPTTPLVALKGCAYLLLELPLARGRVFADVDLLTDPARLDEVESALERHGWRSEELSPYDQNYYRRWTHELPPMKHAERDMEIDLHHNLLPRTARLKPPSALLLRESRPVPGSRYRVLCNEDIVLHAMTHLTFADDLADKLRELVDIADLLRQFATGNDTFWTTFLQRAEDLDLRRPAYYGLRYSYRLLGFGVPVEVLEASGKWAPPLPIRQLMDWLVPHALYPCHPDGTDRYKALPRALLYIRSHWIRMPPWLLAYHLAYKLVVARLRLRWRRSPAGHG